jgi:RNA polymerase sigma-70 factor (ECF subfamily)
MPPHETTHNELSLFRNLATGDEQDFRRVFHYYNARLFPFILKVVKEEEPARELVQDTFLKLWLHRESVSAMDNPSSWLFRVASNLAISYLRTKAAQQRRDIASIQGDTEGEQLHIESGIDAKKLQVIIDEAIDQLPDRRKEIYKLSRLAGLSHKQIAEKLQLSQSTVKNQVVDALKFIEEQIRRQTGFYIPLFVLSIICEKVGV